MKMADENIRSSFIQILIYIKKKQWAIRVFNKILKKRLAQIINSFYNQSIIKRSLEVVMRRSSSKIAELGLKVKPRKFSFKYICHVLNILSNNISFHQNSLKKNTIIKWKAHCANASKLHSIKVKYNRDINNIVACGMLSRVLDMKILSSIRFSFIKILKF